MIMGDFAVIDEDMEYAISRSALDNHWNKIIADGFVNAVKITLKMRSWSYRNRDSRWWGEKR